MYIGFFVACISIIFLSQKVFVFSEQKLLFPFPATHVSKIPLRLGGLTYVHGKTTAVLHETYV